MLASGLFEISDSTILYRLMLDEKAGPRAIAFIRKMIRQYAICLGTSAISSMGSELNATGLVLEAKAMFCRMASLTDSLIGIAVRCVVMHDAMLQFILARGKCRSE